MNLTERFTKSLLAKPFVILTGNSGTGKSKLATLFAEWMAEPSSTLWKDLSIAERRCVFVPVGADWTDNRNVLGYLNLLRQQNAADAASPYVYQATSILELIHHALKEENKDKPYFLILDEMNLSHVERYFSDFLAHLESTDEKIRLHSETKGHVVYSFDHEEEVPCEIPLPSNLFVVGTVNVDETTYMFSPKVLDRANVIEFRTSRTALEKAQNRQQLKSSMSFSGNGTSFLALSQRARALESADILEDPSAGWEDFKKAILEVFDLLQSRNIEFGFRIQKEMLSYARLDHYLLKSAKKDEVTPKLDWDWQRCFDEQLMQKILPKLHGDQSKLDGLLRALAVYSDKGGNLASALEQLGKFPGTFVLKAGATLVEIERQAFEADAKAREVRFPISLAKIHRMLDVLRRDQFVSYIQ
jgi:5-methylcytosine-specific restriction enzyme B